MFRLLFAAAALLTIALPSLAQDAPDPNDSPPPDAETVAGADRMNRLGLALFAAAREARPGNVVSSPWPTYRSLTLALLGAAGETRGEIVRVLGTDDPVADQLRLLRSIDPGISRWNQLVAARQPGDRVDQVEWGTLSGVWLDRRAKLSTTYLAATQRMHGTVVRSIDFTNAGKAVVDVNTWVAQVTRGRIAKLLHGDSFTPLTRLALTSATFFKAPWAYLAQFKPEDTRREQFHVNGEKPELVPTMVRRGAIGSSVHEDFTAVGLNTAGDFQLLILVPAKENGLATLEAKLTPELLRNCAQLKSSRVEIHLPKFRIGSTTLALATPLKSLGIHAAFDRQKADFSAMAHGEDLHLDDVYDAAEFRIDEQGLSGAAATVVTVSALGGDGGTLPADSIFRVNRPFIFALQHIGTGFCVFLGKVTDPR